MVGRSAAVVSSSDLWGDDYESFMSQHWQQRPALVDVIRDPVGDLDLDDVEEIVTTSVTASNIRLVREEAGELRSQSCPTWDDSDRVDPLAMFRFYAEGWTVIANSVDRANGRFSRLAAAFDDMFDLHVNINLYLTPPGAQGFLPHIDGHDVIVLPIVGEKSWEIYDCPLELPLEHQPSPPLEDGTTSEVMHLAPGRMLYIPRGWRHRAWSESGACAHLTVGLHPIRAADLATVLVRAVAERDVRLRVSVPKSEALALGRDQLVELARVIGELPDSIAEEVVTDVRQSVHKRLLRHSGFAPGGTLQAIDRLDGISTETVLRHRSGHEHIVAAGDETASLVVSNTTVTMPAWVEPALDYIATHPSFAVGELPSLTESSALVLARRLVREGLLQIDESPPKKGQP